MDHSQLVNGLYDGMKRQHVLLGCIAALVLLFGANFMIDEAPKKLGLVPISTTIAHSYIWNLVTSSFYETNIIKLALDIFGTVLVGANLDMGRKDQFCIYFFVSIVASTFGASAWSFMRFFVMHKEDMLTSPIYGFAGVLMTLIMYQRMRFKNVPVYALFPSVTYDNLPFLVLSSQIVLRLLGMKFLTRDIIFSVISIHAAWFYLRYFYVKEDDTVGDKSDEFAYYKLVPPLLQPITLPLLTMCHNIFALTGMVPMIDTTTRSRPVTLDHLGRPSGGGAGDAVGSVSQQAVRQADVVSERRRAKAIKLLEARLQQEPTDWDDSTGGGASTTDKNTAGRESRGAGDAAASDMFKV